MQTARQQEGCQATRHEGSNRAQKKQSTAIHHPGQGEMLWQNQGQHQSPMAEADTIFLKVSPYLSQSTQRKDELWQLPLLKEPSICMLICTKHCLCCSRGAWLTTCPSKPWKYGPYVHTKKRKETTMWNCWRPSMGASRRALFSGTDFSSQR